MTARRFFLVSLLALLPILAWDASGLDLPLERWFGNAQGFALAHDWWLQTLLHDGVRRLAWLLWLALALMIWRALGPLCALPRGDRVGLVLGVLLAAAVVQWVKRASATSCPWDLAQFGGTARHVSHWLWGVADGGPGHCFPAGHASTAFSFLAGWFWLRPWAPRAARHWLLASSALGLLLGGVQMVRGAHYLSHVLWAGWLCWLTSGLFWLAAQALARWRRRRDASPPPHD